MEQALEENEEQFRLLVQGVKEIVQAKEALKESQTRYQQLIDLFPDPVMVQRDGEIVFVNEAAIRLLGAENRVQLTGKPMKDIVNPDDWDRLYDHMRRLREEGTAFFIKRTDESQNWQSPFATIEAQLIRVDGAAVDVALMAAPMSFQEQPAVMVFANVLRKSMSA
jgi:PAS domain S-box-containing protein